MAEKKISKFLVQAVNKATMKNGKAYLKLKLIEVGGRIWPAVLWEDRELETGIIVKAQTEEGDFMGTAQLTVHQIRELPEETNIEDYLPKTPHSIDGLLAEMHDFIELVQDPALKALLLDVSTDPRWRRTPAASTMHHAYIGGLLEHTVCLLRLAQAVGGCYGTEVRMDYLYAGAILHDMGKMNEISGDLNMSYTTEGELVGHIGLGLMRANELMNKNEEAFGTFDKPSDLRRRIWHIIASHHGSVSYGALKVPMFVEAQVFCNLDGIDANMGKMRAVIARTGPDKAWSDKAKWDEPKLYLGEIKKEVKPPAENF